jgi:hypothetical protein
MLTHRRKEVGMKSVWVWVLLAAALFVTWLIVIAPHTPPLLIHPG